MRILLAECMQEISSFNPQQCGYSDFVVERGGEILSQRGLNTAVGGALAVFAARDDVEVVPTIAARAPSLGILSAEGWTRLSTEWLAAVVPYAGEVDALYVSLHGAMAAVGELDPEGYLLAELRRRFGPDIPIVISLDLHGILTERMIRQINGLTIYHTYPHVDFADTGERAARLLLDILDRKLRPTIVRAVVPMLARGDECITKTGCYGDVIREAQLLERSGRALAAGVMIGNPFTDVPELCTQAVVVVEDGGGEELAAQLAEAMWAHRHRLVGKLIALDKAVEMAKFITGQVVFTDAADATSSGASGDSNVLIKALRERGYSKRVLAQIVDPAAAAACHAAGVGATLQLSLGGGVDCGRFTPVAVSATVQLLSNGRTRLETMRLPIDAGPCAVVTFDNFTVVILSRPAFLMDRSLYYANGVNPKDFDLIVVKSPHTEFHMYDQWVEKNFNVDAPGSTSANLPSLGHTICARPMYPLDPEAAFTNRPAAFGWSWGKSAATASG